MECPLNPLGRPLVRYFKKKVSPYPKKLEGKDLYDFQVSLWDFTGIMDSPVDRSI